MLYTYFYISPYMMAYSWVLLLFFSALFYGKKISLGKGRERARASRRIEFETEMEILAKLPTHFYHSSNCEILNIWCYWIRCQKLRPGYNFCNRHFFISFFKSPSLLSVSLSLFVFTQKNSHSSLVPDLHVDLPD